MAKLKFQNPLLQFSVSHDPSEIIYVYLIYIDLVLKQHFISSSLLKTFVLLDIFVETMILFSVCFVKYPLKIWAMEIVMHGISRICISIVLLHLVWVSSEPWQLLCGIHTQQRQSHDSSSCPLHWDTQSHPRPLQSPVFRIAIQKQLDIIS